MKNYGGHDMTADQQVRGITAKIPGARKRRMPIRFYLYGLLLCVVAFFYAWDGPKPLQIILAGTPAEMGRQYGSQCRKRIQLLCRLYVRGFICQGNDALVQKRSRHAGKLWNSIDPVYQDEISALSETAKVERNLVLLGNSFIDLGYSAYGCRSVVSGSGPDLIHAHNLDWDNVAGLAKWNICMVRRTPSDGRFRTVAIVLPGLVGALDIINEHGIALSLNQVGYGSGELMEPTFLKLRRIAETCSTFDAARNELSQMSPDTPFILTLSSSAEKLGAVFEPVVRQVVERRLLQGFVTADNTAWGEKPIQSSILNAAQRLQPRTVQEMQQFMRDPDVLLDCNIYSVIFHFADNRLYLASGSAPAARGKYRVFELFGPPQPKAGCRYRPPVLSSVICQCQRLLQE